MKPYYERDGKGQFVPGHKQVKTPSHRAAISAGQRRAWSTKRSRLPIGTRRTDCSGYVVVKVSAGKGPWRLEHAIVVEGLIGRTLTPGEVVHHINGDRSDNRPENLYLCRDRSHHNEVHGSQDAAFRSLLESGSVRFVEGKYEAVLRP